MRRYLLILLLFVILLQGCATPVANRLIRALPESSDKNCNKIVLMRLAKFSGGIISDNVYINNYVIDSINEGIYKEYKVPSGEFTIYVTSGGLSGPYTSNIVQLKLKACETKYLVDEHILGFLANNLSLYEINENEAKEKMKNMKRGKIQYTLDKYPVIPFISDASQDQK